MPPVGFLPVVSICASEDRKAIVLKMHGRDIARITAGPDGVLNVEPLVDVVDREELEKAIAEALVDELAAEPPRPGERPA